MAMSDRSKKSNLCYLLLYGGTKVCRALFEKRVNDLKPNGEDSKTWTVDKFLQLNRTKIESKLGREEMMKQTLVFPVAPRTTDINLWDVSLFCLILRETCDVSPELRMFLQHLRKLRNKIVHHLNDEDIDDSKYGAIFEKLEVCIDKVLSSTGDETLKRTVQDMITQLKSGLIPNDELLKVEKSIEDMKQAVSHEHQETRQVIEKGMKTVTSMLDKVMRYQQEILRRLEGQAQVENPPPEMTVEVRTCNCSHQVGTSASEVMAELFNKDIDNDSGLPACTGDIKELNHAVNDLCREFKEKDFTITKVDVGCIVLHIQCSSILSLLTLLRDYLSGSLDKALTKLEKAARSLDGCENLRLETVIYEDEFNRVFSDLNFEQFLVSVKEELSPDVNLPDETSALQPASEKEKLLFGRSRALEELRRHQEEMRRQLEEIIRRHEGEMRRQQEIRRQEEEYQRKIALEQFREIRRQQEYMEKFELDFLKTREIRRQEEEYQRKIELEQSREFSEKFEEGICIGFEKFRGTQKVEETKISSLKMPVSTEKVIDEHRELTTYKRTEQDK